MMVNLQWIQLNPVEMFDCQADLPLYPGLKPWVPGPPAVSIQSMIIQQNFKHASSECFHADRSYENLVIYR